jgi:hypothetical protein
MNKKFVVIAVSGILCAVRLCSGWESTLFPEVNEGQQLAIVEFSCVIDPRSEKLNSRKEAIHFTHNEGVKANAMNVAETYTQLNQFDAGDRFLVIYLRYNVVGNRSLPYRSWSGRRFIYRIENGKAVVTIDGTKKRIDLDEFIDRVMAWFSVTESKEQSDGEGTIVPTKRIMI